MSLTPRLRDPFFNDPLSDWAGMNPWDASPFDPNTPWGRRLMPWNRPMEVGCHRPHLHADMCECDDKFMITVDVPGVKKKNVKLDLEGNTLSVSVVIPEVPGESKDAFKFMDRPRGKSTRRFMIPDNVDTEHISAKHEDGVLHITLPKTAGQSSSTKKITVN